MGIETAKTHQYEPIRTPAGWDGEEKQLIVQLTRIFDDLYRRFNRLRFEDLGPALRGRIEDGEGNLAEIKRSATELSATVASLDGDVASLSLTQTGIAAAVDNNRLVFSATGLEIKNAAGLTVFRQDNDIGDLVITGNLAATSGSVGGFTIADSALHNGTSIYLGADGYVRLGGLVAADDPDTGPTLQGNERLSLRVGDADYLSLGGGEAVAQFPVKARFGLFVDPGEVTANAPNAYIDPVTGKLYRVAGSSPDTLVARLEADRGVVTLGGELALLASVSGGTAPVAYAFAVSRDSGPYAAIPGSGASRAYTPSAAGLYRFRVTATDSASNMDIAYTGVIRAVAASPLAVAVSATKSLIRSAATVTWKAEITGGVGPFTTMLVLYKDGTAFDSASGTALTRQLTATGRYTARAQVVDLTTGATLTAGGGTVTFSEPIAYGKTLVANMAVRISPETVAAVLTRIPSAGSLVAVRGPAGGGWLPVSANGVSGYALASQIQILESAPA